MHTNHFINQFHLQDQVRPQTHHTNKRNNIIKNDNEDNDFIRSGSKDIERIQINYQKTKRLKGIYLNCYKINKPKYQPLTFIIPAMLVKGAQQKKEEQNDHQNQRNRFNNIRIKDNKASTEKNSNQFKLSHQYKYNFGQTSKKLIQPQNIELRAQYYSAYMKYSKITSHINFNKQRSQSFQLKKTTNLNQNNAEQKKHQVFRKKTVKQFNVQNIVRRREGKNFELFMNQFTRRMQMKPNAKIFIFNSGDSSIKKMLIEKDWVQNTTKDSTAFHFKWSAKVQTLPKFRQQKINHFPESDWITSKTGLIKHTSKSQELKYYMPRTYDLRNQSEIFRKQFIKTGMEALLKKISQYIRSSSYMNKEIVQIQPSNLNMHFKQMLIKEQYFDPNKDHQVILHIPYMIQVCYYFLNQFQKQNNVKDTFFLDLFQFTQQKLINFSKLNPPYNQLLGNKTSLEKEKGDINIYCSPKLVFQADFNHYKTNTSFYQPSQKLMNLLISIDSYCQTHYHNYLIDGINNLWITKSGVTSKGIGINIEKSYEQIVKNGQHKLVQKYIQKCLIINNQTFISQKKFDLRVWVLVESFTPLKVSYYRQFYGRICSSKYTLNDILNQKAHLTNYSLNKGWFECQQKSVIKGSQLLGQISRLKEINYEQMFYSNLQKILKLVFECYKDKIVNREQCFELFGFDILIDSYLQLHLLQVNLSPACKQRVCWLTQLCQKMSKSLLQIVLEGRQCYQDWIKLY